MYLVHRKLQHVADFASGDISRPSLQRVQVTKNGESIQLRATDGQRAITVTDTVPQKVEDYPVIPGLDANTNGYAAYLPSDTFVKACRAVPKKTHAPILEYLAVSADEKTVTLASTDLATPTVQTIKQPEDPTFPNIDAATPESNPVFTIGFDPKLLGETLLALAKMLDNSPHDVCQLDFYGPKSPVRITAGKETTFEILVAPKRVSA